MFSLQETWQTKTKSKKSAAVVLAVECKTMRGFHILVNDAPIPLLFQTSGLAHWVGYTIHDERERIGDLLRKHQYSPTEAIQVLKGLSKACYPRGMASVYGLLVPPPPVPVCFTAFRETNVGSEKDLDSSVLWRAFLALDSCTNSLEKSRTDAFFDDLSIDALAFQHDGEEKLSVFVHTIDRYSKSVWLYHPVVVTDAKLWRSAEGTLTELKMARYVRTDGFYSVNKWFDVVPREHFPEYAEHVASHYEEVFRSVRAKGAQ
jgi:hypothetical protein